MELRIVRTNWNIGKREWSVDYHEAGLADPAVAEQADLEADHVVAVHRCVVVLPSNRRRPGPVAAVDDGRPDAAVPPAAAAAAGGAREQLVPHKAQHPGGDGEAEQARPAQVGLAPPPRRAGAELRGRRRDVHGGLCRPASRGVK
jgi:hypothetical protein